LKILLTGASGMVGRNILESEKAYLHEFLTPSSQTLDLADRRMIDLFLAEHKPEMIIHCAGLVGGIHANIAYPVDFLQANALMGLNIVCAAKDHQIPELINLASSCMYPRLAENPLREEMLLSGELEPTNEGYAIAKLMTTRLCEYVCRETPHLNYRTLIPCNLYGRFDNFETNRSHLIPAVIHKLHTAKANDDDTVEIWGDGSARREFMYAGDLADFIFAVLPKLSDLPLTMNVGVGIDYSITEYYKSAATVVGFQGDFVYDTSKPVGMQQKLMDVRFQQLLDWMPRTSLDLGLEKTYEYYVEGIDLEICASNKHLG